MRKVGEEAMLTPLAVLCAVLSAGAVALLMRPGQGLHRMSGAPKLGELAGAGVVRRLRDPTRGPFAIGRLLLLGGSSLALALALSTVPGGPGPWCWIGAPILLGLGLAGTARLKTGSARRREAQVIEELPQALELMAACLAAGMPVRAATRAIVAAFPGALGDHLARVEAQVDLGVPDAEAWAVLRPDPVLGAAAAEVARTVEAGTRLVEGLLEHAAVARGARHSALRVRARGIGVRSVWPMMLCFLPAFMLLGVVPTVASAVLHALR